MENLLDLSKNYIQQFSEIFESSTKAKDVQHLRRIIDKNIREFGPNCDLNHIDISEVTNMRGLFNGLEFNGDISKWDVAHVENMLGMFSNSTFNGDISNWNVSKVESMAGMFQGSKFNSDISKWDVSNVQSMSAMFSNSKFNGDISNWNVSNVLYMNSMFKGSEFNGNISNWNVSNVREMSHMLAHSKFTGDISNWNVSKVDTMWAMFEESKFNSNISKWDVSNVSSMSEIFKNSEFTGDISNWNVSNVYTMRNMFEGSKFNSDISKWDVSHVENMSEIFKNSEFTGNISNWDVSNVRKMRGMFQGSQFNSDISKWDVSHVENMSEIFKNSEFTGNISKWDVSNVKIMEGMFEGSKFNGDISRWNVEKMRDIHNIFKGSDFNGDISNWRFKVSFFTKNPDDSVIDMDIIKKDLEDSISNNSLLDIDVMNFVMSRNPYYKTDFEEIKYNQYIEREYTVKESPLLNLNKCIISDESRKFIEEMNMIFVQSKIMNKDEQDNLLKISKFIKTIIYQSEKSEKDKELFLKDMNNTLKDLYPEYAKKSFEQIVYSMIPDVKEKTLDNNIQFLEDLIPKKNNTLLYDPAINNIYMMFKQYHDMSQNEKTILDKNFKLAWNIINSDYLNDKDFKLFFNKMDDLLKHELPQYHKVYLSKFLNHEQENLNKFRSSVVKFR